jgi:hypothetical protein
LSEIEAFVFQTGAATPGGSNTHIQYNKSDVLGGSAAFTFNEATNTVNLSNTLTIGSNVTVNTSTIFIGNSTVNTTIIAGNVDLQGTQLRVGNVIINGNTLTIGNSTVNTVINSTSVSVAGGATFSGDLMPSANITYDIGNTSMRWRDLYLSGSTINLGGATIQTDNDTGAIAIIPKPTEATPNPIAVVVSPTGGVTTVTTTAGVPAANAVAEAASSNTAAPVPIDVTTTAPSNGQILVWNSSGNTFAPNSVVPTLAVGNSTVNTIVANTTSLSVGSNVVVNTSSIVVGNSTVKVTIDSTSINGSRMNPRVVSTATTASLTPDISAADQYNVTALDTALTINAPIGTPVDGNKLMIRLLDNGTTRALTWNGTYTVIGTTLPTSTTANKMSYIGCIYNAANTRWDVIAVTTQA